MSKHRSLEDGRSETIARTLASRAGPSVVTYLFLSWFVAAVTHYRTHHPWLVVWMVLAMSTVSVWRIGLMRSVDDRRRGSARSWIRGFRVASVTAGALWGASLAMAVVEGGLETEDLVLAASTVGVAAGAMVSLSPDGWSQRAYLAVALSPTIAAGVYVGDAASLSVAAAALLFGAYLVTLGDRIRRDFLETLDARDLLELRACELDRARRRAERADYAKSGLLLQLEQSCAAAEAASRAKSEFLANMSHEIRTPLAAILGYADLMQSRGLLPEDRVSFAGIIRKNGEQLLGLLSDILDLSKVEAGQMSADVAPVDLQEVLADTLSLLRVKATERHLGLTLACEGPIPKTIRTDGVRLRQILLNLLGNAIKFTEKGSVSLRVACAVDGGRGRLRIAITDTGIGMTHEQVGRMFQPFTQADASTTRRFGGTGLGLAISRRLARLLGGDITVKSAPGVGSTFVLEVDAGAITAGSPRFTQLVSSRETLTPPPLEHTAEVLRGARVLLAEDSVDNQRLIALHLGRAGIAVDLATDGRAAVERACAAEELGSPYDVVLMDMQMPELDGYAATTLLRARGYTGNIVALTANAMKGDRDRCLAAGCDEHMTKPFRPSRLVAAVTGARLDLSGVHS